MIDNLVQVDRLLSKLRSSLPVAAKITPELAGVLRDQLGGEDVPASCELTRIDYAGDEGGIVCKLEFGREMGGRVFFASITHLRQANALKEVVLELTLENRVLKKSMIGDGGDDA